VSESEAVPGPDRVPVELPLLRPLFDVAGPGILALDDRGAVTAVNPAIERLLGYPEEELLGRPIHDLVNRRPDGSVLARSECPVLEALRTGRPAEGTEAVVLRRSGEPVTLTWGAAPVVLAGQVTGLVVACYPAGEREAERASFAATLAEAEQTNARLALLSETSTLLAGSLELTETMRRLAGLVVPMLGDWSVVDLVEETQTVRRVALAHREQGQVTAGELIGQLPLGGEPGGPLGRVLVGGEAMLLADIGEPPPRADPLTAAQYELFGRLAARSAVIAPLRARSGVVGALTVARTVPGGYSEQDVTLVEDLARRAALAVDNARLYGLHRRAAEVLQRSLLTDPPQLPGITIRAHYRPAARETRLGGDWYDAFLLEDGSLAVAIGDVAGHDVPAAARMAQLRSLLRGAALGGDPPDRVVDRLDRAATHLDVTDLATVLYGRLRRTPGWSLEWSNAGHPPPLLVRPGPEPCAEFLAGPVDPPIGVGAPVQRRAATNALPAGAAVLLYTDGLVETRGQPIDKGLGRLSAVAASAGPDTERLVAAVLDELGTGAEDDVALLAIRVD
jgi:PAS domain S-box-containing protein